MEPITQPTFIPRKTLAPQPAQSKPERSMSLFSLIATIAFITAIVVSAATFGVEYYFKGQRDLKADLLQTELDKFEPALIADLSRLDSRIESSKELIKKHTVLSAFLNSLNAMTLRTVRFTGFSYSASDKKVTLSMDGQAQSFAAVALQAAEFAKPENERYIRDVAFSDLTVDLKGNVLFRLTATVNPQVLLFSEAFNTKSVTIDSAASDALESTTGTTTASTTKPTTR